MERKQTKLYRVLQLRDGRVFDFDRAQQVADHIFVLGNFDLPNFPIFKNGKRWKPHMRFLLMEVREYARALDEWQP